MFAMISELRLTAIYVLSGAGPIKLGMEEEIGHICKLSFETSDKS